jgi:phage tail-like protein
VIDAPVSASARGYLTNTLPAVYTEDERPSFAIDRYDAPAEPFVVRWLGGLEQVLDPVVTLLDNLAWHLDADTCPDDLVLALLCWLGLEAVAGLEPEVRRRLLRRAMALGRARGTLAGLSELLAIAFDGLGIRVTHSGTATQGPDPSERPKAHAPQVVVRSPHPLSAVQREALARLVNYACPAHVDWSLEIGAP